MLLFGVVGFAVRKLDYPSAPLILAFVLGPLAEEFLRQALSISGGSLLIFVERPISLTLVLGVVLTIGVMPAIRWWRQRNQIGVDED
jgi:putative tricarboxylic transport membrane protein